MYKKFAVLCFIVFYSVSTYSQQIFEDFRSEVNQDMCLLSDYDYHRGDSYDPDSLAMEIGKKIVDYANINNFKNFNAEEFPCIMVDTVVVNNEEMIGLYFGYHSGGTAGSIWNSVLIREKEGRVVAYDFTDIEIGFFSIDQLSPEIYLVMGAVGGSSTCRATAIHIIDMSADVPQYCEIFTDQIEFIICNADANFDKDTNLLTIEIDHLPSYAEDTCAEEFIREKYEHFSVECFDADGDAAILRTKYNGKKFVKPE